MRVALKIAYDGSAFFGHQRQPDRRTVEGECLAALRAGEILQDPQAAFFRSASRTDRGVSAVGNTIAFDSSLRADAVVGAFNDHARGVWAWAYAEVPSTFHPRHAIERWYRYHLYEDVPTESLHEAASLFPGEHDFRAFTSDSSTGRLVLNRVDVAREDDAIVIDVRAPSFRRGMVRRIVAAMAASARGDVTLEAIRRALDGTRHDFGSVPARPLFLMDVVYAFPFQVLRKPKSLDEWRDLWVDAALRLRWLDAIESAASGSFRG
jgi:tRNA pseudouridine38-40 synthase